MVEEKKLDSRIKRAGDLATESFKELKKIQSGEKPIIKTGQAFIDCHLGGVLPSDVILYAASSGVGKTKLLYDTIDSLLDEDVNKNASNFVTLQFELEMKFLNKILRDTNTLTKKKKGDILSQQFTPEEQEIVKRYYEGLQDGRRYIVEDTINTDDFYNMVDSFCELHKDKDAIWVTLDHYLLVQGDDVAQKLTAIINILRKRYNNVYFIILSQLNRSGYANTKERDNIMMPNTGAIYGSSHFEFLSSFIIVLMDPFKMGVNQYMKFNRDRYDWLEDFMTDEDKKGKVSFETIGNQFIHTLKMRESDAPFLNLHIRTLDITNEQRKKMEQSVDKKEETVSDIQVPVFNSSNSTGKLIPMAQALTKPSILDNFGYDKMQDEDQDAPF